MQIFLRVAIKKNILLVFVVSFFLGWNSKLYSNLGATEVPIARVYLNGTVEFFTDFEKGKAYILNEAQMDPSQIFNSKTTFFFRS